MTADSTQTLTVGYGANGVTGPTTPAFPSPVCGGASWPHEIVTRGYETVAIFPAHDIGGVGCPEHDIEPAQSYARKFAAVDDLLIEAKRAAEVMERHIYPKPDVGPDHPYSVLQALQAVIAKAEGRS